jgi:Rps23 Pro-64 3,4-dihydroxylase Tpa1-like proline 4-hydroxylase
VISVDRWDLPSLRRRWLRARPFPHVILDSLLSADDHARALQAFQWEPHYLVRGEIYAQLRSETPPQQPVVRELFDALTGPALRVAVESVTGKRIVHADGNGYVYLEGHYLLPHSDSQASRAVAYAYYLSAPSRGGELELHACTRRGNEIVATKRAKRIAPRPNRLVLFDVTPASLHEVREVTKGARLSMAGWYYGE